MSSNKKNNPNSNNKNKPRKRKKQKMKNPLINPPKNIQQTKNKTTEQYNNKESIVKVYYFL